MRLLPLLVATSVFAVPAAAQDREVPYWASIKTDKLRMRVGPGPDFPIRWVYKREGLPLKVVRVHEGWRLVRDPDGAEGWVSVNLLSAARGAIVVGDGLAAIRSGPSDGAALRWNAEPGVVGKLGDCAEGWCEIDVAGRRGHIRADRLWGAGNP